jgi:glycosyltransferase involved in cell wall biosynthesis
MVSLPVRLGRQIVRVMQVMGSDKRGGAEAFFARLTVALGEAGVSQQVVIRRGAADCREILRAGGIEPVELPFLFNYDLLTRHLLGRLLDRFAPDVVLTWMSRATTACPPGDFVRVARLGGYYHMKYFMACDHLVGNTRDLVDYVVAHGFPPSRAWYLPNFVDEAADAEPADRACLATPPGVPVLLALGRLHSDKAFDVLLAALARLDGVWLWLAGEGPLEGRLKGLAESLGVAGRVRFLGWRRDVPALLKAADCLVCPSRIEPLGNVILEAWVHRRPVVAAAAKGPAGLIADGEDGLLVGLEDADALARAIRRVLDSPGLASALAEAGFAAYRARFSRAAVVARYVDFLAKVTSPCAE